VGHTKQKDEGEGGFGGRSPPMKGVWGKPPQSCCSFQRLAPASMDIQLYFNYVQNYRGGIGCFFPVTCSPSLINHTNVSISIFELSCQFCYFGEMSQNQLFPRILPFSWLHVGLSVGDRYLAVTAAMHVIQPIANEWPIKPPFDNQQVLLAPPQAS